MSLTIKEVEELGVSAFYAGVCPEANPFANDVQRAAWECGWWLAYEELDASRKRFARSVGFDVPSAIPCTCPRCMGEVDV